MEYIVAVLGLSVACVAWYYIQQITGHYDGSSDPETAHHAEDKSFGCSSCSSGLCSSASNASSCATRPEA